MTPSSDLLAFGATRRQPTTDRTKEDGRDNATIGSQSVRRDTSEFYPPLPLPSHRSPFILLLWETAPMSAGAPRFIHTLYKCIGVYTVHRIHSTRPHHENKELIQEGSPEFIDNDHRFYGSSESAELQQELQQPNATRSSSSRGILASHFHVSRLLARLADCSRLSRGWGEVGVRGSQVMVAMVSPNSDKWVRTNQK